MTERRLKTTMSNIFKSSSDKKCFRCERTADGDVLVWHLRGEGGGFCEPCILELLKLMLVVEKVDKGEID